MDVAATERIVLRWFREDDAPFILELLNDPSFLRFVGDKGVRTIDDARAYLRDGPLAMYERHGLGLYHAALRFDGTPLGMCGLLKRDNLADVDVGFAFLPQHCGQGYALEAAEATMRYGRDELGLDRIVAITSPDNDRSARLLGKLGLHFDRMVTLDGETEPSRLFVPRDPVLRPVEDADLDVFFAHGQDPEACRMAAFTHDDPSDRAAFYANWERMLGNDKIVLRTVVHDGAVAGHVGSFERDGVPEVTYWIGRAFWGNGVATRALTDLLEIVAVRPIHARVAKDNAGSIRVLRKCGFSVTAEERGFAAARGEEIAELVMTLGSQNTNAAGG